MTEPTTAYPEKRPVGRPPLTEEVKAARAAAKREYLKKYKLEHKDAYNAAKQRSVTRIHMDKKYWCAQYEFERQHEHRINTSPSGSAAITAQ